MEFIDLLSVLDPCIFVIVKTWLKPNDYFSFPNKFEVFSRGRESRGKGILIDVQKTLCPPIRYSSSNYKILTVDVNLPGLQKNYHEKVTCISTYLPPSLSTELIRHCFLGISAIIEKCKNFIILGDSNWPQIDWNSLFCPKSEEYELLLNFYIENQPISQIINKPTRYNNILDLVFTNLSEYLDRAEILPPLGSSDHSVIKTPILFSASIKYYIKFPLRWL